MMNSTAVVASDRSDDLTSSGMSTRSFETSILEISFGSMAIDLSRSEFPPTLSISRNWMRPEGGCFPSSGRVLIDCD